jgi:hypothetical protein
MRLIEYNEAVIRICSQPGALLLLVSFVAIEGRAEPDERGGEPVTLEAVVELVNTHCGSCHSVPPPNLMPKRSWPKVVQAMADLAAQRTGQESIPSDALRHITAYYYGSSPEELPLLPYVDAAVDGQGYRATEIGDRTPMPMVIDIVPADLGVHHGAGLLVCDAESNELRLLKREGDEWRETVLAEAPVPIRSEVVDFDGDGDTDIVVAALGILPPSDELAGKVLLLRQDEDGGFDKEILLEGIGRTTDARAIDVDNDDDLDLVVAIFGGGTVGGIVWLETTGTGEYVAHEVLGVSGPLNATPVDLDADGRMDFVSLIAQEYESVVAFMNRGQGRFEQLLLGRAPHPMYGFTGMSLADLDGDDDPDILMSNGDAMDTQPDPKPYHGVQWLENRGNLTFEFHDIGRFYGAAVAAAGDVDGDGDLDVVAGSWLNFWDDPRRQSLVWYENDGRKGFSQRGLLSRPAGIVSLALADVTGDDKADIVAGVLRLDLMTKMMTGEAPQGTETRMLLLERPEPTGAE